MKDLSSIPDDGKYPLFAALRGPDLQGARASRLKAITNKLRALVFDPNEVQQNVPVKI